MSDLRQIVFTVTEFETFSLVLCTAQVPEAASFAVTMRPRSLLEELCNWQEASSRSAILLLRLLKQSKPDPVCLSVAMGQTDLGHLHFLPPFYPPQLFCFQEGCQHWGVELRLRLSDPFARNQ